MKAQLHIIRAARVLCLAGAATWQAHSQSAEDLRVSVGKSIVLDYPTDVTRISTSNPEVIDAVAVTTREVVLNSKGQGMATLVIWSKDGQRTLYNITVEPNLDPLRRQLRESFPKEDVQVVVGRDSVSLIGRTSTQSVADRATAMASAFAKTVVNNLQVATTPVDRQIVLRVKFAELNRSVISAFGVNIASTGGANTIGRTTPGGLPAPSVTRLAGGIPSGLGGSTSEFAVSDALNIFAFRPDLGLAAFIRALQQQGVLQILAEPNIVTTNGKEANFLVGGEFPVPVLQGGGNAGAVTVQFREFGIRLNFLPTLTGNGTIRMFVKPEVSTIDLANAVQLGGFTIPALATRRVESTVELIPGQSFAIAGLVDDRVQDTLNKIPGLANIPILGNLFKNRNETKQKTELVILVTPEIVDPSSFDPNKALPAFPKEFLPPLQPDSDGRPMSATPTVKKGAQAGAAKAKEKKG